MFKIYQDIQVQLLYYKYMYYEAHIQSITDHQYDVLEKISKQMAKALYLDKDPNNVHNMIGFTIESPYWEKVKERLK